MSEAVTPCLHPDGPPVDAPLRILLIRLDGLGDTVLTTPLLAAIRKQWPRSSVTVIASATGDACLANHPGVGNTIVFSHQHSTIAEKLALGRRLKSASFDVAITVTEKAWAYAWLRMSRAPRRIGFWPGWTKPLKSCALAGALTDRVPEFPELHETERHLKLLAPLGLDVNPGPLWLPHAPPDQRIPGRVALHLSGKWLRDGWDSAWLATLTGALASAAPGGLLVSAGGLEREWARSFCAEYASAERGPARVDTEHVGPPEAGRVEFVVDPPFDRWVDALSRCQVLVSTDTGAVHVGAALGLSVVDVFPANTPSADVLRWKPWKVSYVIILRPPGPENANLFEQEILRATRNLMQLSP